MRKHFLVALACGLLAIPAAPDALAQSFRPFVVKDIRVEGLQRTEAGTVFGYLPVKVGESMTQEKAQQAIRALFATGFFRDVRLEVENDVLIVLVEERPAIAQIDFSGIKEFGTDVLRKIMRDAGLSEGRIFDRAVLETAEQELKRQYLSRGFYAAEVQTTVTPLERNRVGLNFSVVEGEVARIRGINFVGANAFREKDLADLFVLRTPGWLTWYTKQDQYSKQKLSADLETLRAHYQNRGYLDFNVDSTQVSISPDKRDIYITVNITEGEKYTVSDVRLAGTFLVPKEELEKLVKVKPGDVFSREKLTETTKAIGDRLGNEGYAFANANAAPNVDKAKRTVAFTILIDPGRRVYVRRINVAGNTKTRDEVIRREMRQLEGAFYDNSKIQQSRRRIDRTQYFDDVTVETLPVPENQDQVDVNYTVKEKPTGALLLGAGFSSAERFVVSSSISQNNIFGSGKHVSAEISSGRINRVYALSYTNPYFTIDGVSQGFDIYKRDVDASRLSLGAYKTKSTGGGIRFGYPLSDTTSINFGLAGERVDLETFTNSPIQYKDFVRQFGNRYMYGTASVGWTRDTLDAALTPTTGSLTRAGAELAGGDLQFYRLSLKHKWYAPLSPTFTLALGTDLGYADGLSGKSLPFFKNFYAGGISSVRGFRDFSLGPQDIESNSLGGNRMVTGNAEILFPVPGAEKDRSLRLGVFLDAGQVYGAGEKLTLSELRYSMGFSIAWSSPFGPLRLSIAQPLNAKPQDRRQRLQFGFGTAF
ncbi:MAG: outer membrane protein assembly factor BamA [Burkholderiales bacterium]|uniref:outer membrane protein assembly factor BamA n=1 Tax=Bradyrhizobium sp. TaxID=376 RepID=UPI003D0B06A7